MKLTEDRRKTIQEYLICALWFIAGMAFLAIGLKTGIITTEML